MEQVTFRYEVEEGTNTARIWVSSQEEPVVIQPHWPNNEAWTFEEATAWAEQSILAYTDPTAALPGPSREEPTVNRPDPADIPINQITPRELDELIAAKIAEALAAK